MTVFQMLIEGEIFLTLSVARENQSKYISYTNEQMNNSFVVFIFLDQTNVISRGG